MAWLDLDSELEELFDTPHVLSGEAQLPQSWEDIGEAWTVALVRERADYSYLGPKDYAGQWTGAAPTPGFPEYDRKARGGNIAPALAASTEQNAAARKARARTFLARRARYRAKVAGR